jgi:hypothetical protein
MLKFGPQSPPPGDPQLTPRVGVDGKECAPLSVSVSFPPACSPAPHRKNPFEVPVPPTQATISRVSKSLGLP